MYRKARDICYPGLFDQALEALNMDIITEKRCCHCNEIKSINEFSLSNEKYVKDGHARRCKICDRQIMHDYYLRNTDKVKARNNNYHNNNPEKIKEIKKKWNKENKDKIKDYFERNKEHISDYRKNNYKKNPNKQKERSKKYFENNPLAKEKKREKQRLWGRNNKDKLITKTKNRRAREQSCGGHISPKEWRELLLEANYKCQKCGATEDLTLDHIVPIFLGGSGNKHNGQVLCRSCNSQKGIKIIDYRNNKIDNK